MPKTEKSAWVNGIVGAGALELDGLMKNSTLFEKGNLGGVIMSWLGMQCIGKIEVVIALVAVGVLR